MIGLRMIWGVSLKEIELKFGKKYLDQFLKSTQKFLDKKLLFLENNCLKTTQKGKYLYSFWFLTIPSMRIFIVPKNDTFSIWVKVKQMLTKSPKFNRIKLLFYFHIFAHEIKNNFMYKSTTKGNFYRWFVLTGYVLK